VKAMSQTINAFTIQMQLIFTFNFKLEHILAENSCTSIRENMNYVTLITD